MARCTRQACARPRGAGSPEQPADERGVVLVWLVVTLTLLLGVAAFAHRRRVLAGHEEPRAARRRRGRARGRGELPGQRDCCQRVGRRARRRQRVPSGSSGSRSAANGTCTLPPGATTAVCGGAGDAVVPVQGHGRADGATTSSAASSASPSTVVRASAEAEYLEAALDGQPVEPVRQRPRQCRELAGQRTLPDATRTSGPTSRAETRSSRTATRTRPTTATSRPTAARASAQPEPRQLHADGYYYAVDFTTTATVKLQAFDPAFVNVGDTCTRRRRQPRGRGRAADDASRLPAGHDNTADIAKRYRPVDQLGQPDRSRFPVLHRRPTLPEHGRRSAPSTTYTVLKANGARRSQRAQPVRGARRSRTRASPATSRPRSAAGSLHPAHPVRSPRTSASGSTLCPVTGTGRRRVLHPGARPTTAVRGTTTSRCAA